MALWEGKLLLVKIWMYTSNPPQDGGKTANDLKSHFKLFSLPNFWENFSASL